MKRDPAKEQRFLSHLEPLAVLLNSYCRRHLLNESSVEDTLQTVVTLAFQDFHRFVEGTNFRAWMFRYLNLEIRTRNRRWLADRQRSESFAGTRAPSSPVSPVTAPISEELLDWFLENVSGEPRSGAVLDHGMVLVSKTKRIDGLGIRRR